MLSIPFARPARAALAATLTLLLAVAAAPPADAADDAPRVRLVTTLGDIVLELDRARAPLSVANFLDYVDAGYYDGTLFHRVIDGFMIQGGGFGEGYVRKPTRPSIPNEANNGLSNRRYTIAMARTNAPHSATAQFFINVADNANLDHTAPTPRGWGYTVFGEVVDGRETVDRIAEVATGPSGPFGRDVPLEPVVIERAVRVPAEGAADAAAAGEGAAAEPAPSAEPEASAAGG